MPKPYKLSGAQYGTQPTVPASMGVAVNWEKMTGTYTPAATKPPKPAKKKLAAQVAKKKRPAKPKAKKRSAPKPSALSLSPGRRQSPVWDKVILPHLDAIVENAGPFASLGRARDAAKEELKRRRKGLSSSAIERGIKRNRSHCFKRA